VQLKANAVTTGKVLNGTLLGVDFKASQVPFGKIGPAGPAGPAGAAGAAGPGTANSTLTTIVVNEYAAAGSADFQCQANTGTLAANFIKIAAIRVANLTNSG